MDGPQHVLASIEDRGAGASSIRDENVVELMTEDVVIAQATSQASRRSSVVCSSVSGGLEFKSSIGCEHRMLGKERFFRCS